MEVQCLRLDSNLDNLIFFNRLDGYQFADAGAGPGAVLSPTGGARSPICSLPLSQSGC